MSPHLSPHLGLVSHREPTAHLIPHSLDHTPRGYPPLYRLGVPDRLVIRVWTSELVYSGWKRSLKSLNS